MKKYFWHPFLIFGGALLLLLVVARFIPAWNTSLLAFKKLDVVQRIADSFTPSKADSLRKIADEMHIASAQTPLAGFRAKLAEQKKNPSGSIRIAYFGDSIIEGDLISGKLREQFQLNYGGSGVGLVPITSIVNEFRRTVKHSFSRNWETLSFMKRGAGKPALGMIGYTFIPRSYYYEETVIELAPAPVEPVLADSLGNPLEPVPEQPVETKTELRRYYVDGPSWVEYAGVQHSGGASEFRHVRLFYSHASSGSYVRISQDGGDFATYNLTPGEGVQVLSLSPSVPLKKVRFEFSPADPLHLYGVSFDEPAGVFVDNLSVRGFSGLNFSAIPAGVLSAFQRQLDYDLVILQYGENVSRADIRDYSFYKKGMLASVRHIQSALPGVPILLISAHDRSVKHEGQYITSPDIPLLVNAQGEVALETGSAFWNLFDAMGGLGSMPSFVNASPPLAGRDYTHFTIAGANKIAGMLFGFLTAGK